MPSPPIADITIGADTWVNADWDANSQGTLSEVGNAIGAAVSLLASIPAVVKYTSAGTLNISAAGFYCIKKTVGANTSVILQQAIGGVIMVKDAKGDAGDHPIAITVAAGGTIDGDTTLYLALPRQGAAVIWNGDEYSVAWTV